MILKSCGYGKLSKFCKVFNSNEIDETLCVRLPFEMNGYRLYDILDVSEAPARTVSFEGVCFDECHPWVDIPWRNLSRTGGYHVYKMSFMNDCKKKYFNTYVSYLIQDSDPHKPYVYMKNRYNSDDSDKAGKYVGVEVG